MKIESFIKVYLRARERQDHAQERLEATNKKRLEMGQRKIEKEPVWTAKEWFLSACIPVYSQISNPVEVRSFYRNNQYHCNVAARFVHLDTPVSSLTKENKLAAERIRLHILNALCNGDKSQLDLFERCLARTSHGLMNDVIPVFNTPQGMGKSMIATFLTLVFGKEAVITTNSSESMLGTHNGDLEGRSLVIYSDVELGGAPGAFRGFYNKLKGATGESTERIRKMGKDGYMVENRKTYIIFTNPEKNPIAPESGDQRVKVFDVNIAWVNDEGRHGAHYAQLGSDCNDNGAAAFYFSYLRNLYDPSWQPRAAVFTSNAQTTAREESLHPFLAFIKTVFLDREPTVEVGTGKVYNVKEPSRRITSELANTAAEWCQRNKFEAKINVRTPGKCLSPLGLEPPASAYDPGTKRSQSMVTIDPVKVALVYQQKGWWKPPHGWEEGLSPEDRERYLEAINKK
nr:primase-helicase family protein [Nitrosomonas nitrosa]